MTEKNRRSFLKTTAGAVAGMNLLIKQSGWSANDTVNVAVTGVRGRGGSHISGHQSLPNVNVVAMCDIDENVLNDRAQGFQKKYNKSVKKFTDYREMLEDPGIDVVSIATPNHWHSVMGIWACQAGKHSYIEKPLSHNIYEGRKLVEAARKYNCVVQHGTQIRSSAAIQEAMQMIHEGVLGEVYYAKGTCYKWRDTIGRKEEKAPPEGVHYNDWLGPSPDRPFTENRFHYNWHWHWDYGNGDIGNQGVHQMDVCRWGLGVGHPSVAQALGGHFMFDDDQETPNTLVATFKYPEENKMMVFEVRHWCTQDELGEGSRGNVVGCLFLGSKGYMVIPSYSKYQIYLGKNRKKGPGRSEGGNHFANFIDAVRAGDNKRLNAEVEEGHVSSALCHLANAAYRVEDTLQFDPVKERVTNNKQADDIIQDKDRKYRKQFSIPKNV